MYKSEIFILREKTQNMLWLKFGTVFTYDSSKACRESDLPSGFLPYLFKTPVVLKLNETVSFNWSEDVLVKVENLQLKLCFIYLTVMVHTFLGVTFLSPIKKIQLGKDYGKTNIIVQIIHKKPRNWVVTLIANTISERINHENRAKDTFKRCWRVLKRVAPTRSSCNTLHLLK